MGLPCYINTAIFALSKLMRNLRRLVIFLSVIIAGLLTGSAIFYIQKNYLTKNSTASSTALATATPTTLASVTPVTFQQATSGFQISLPSTDWSVVEDSFTPSGQTTSISRLSIIKKSSPQSFTPTGLVLYVADSKADLTSTRTISRLITTLTNGWQLVNNTSHTYKNTDGILVSITQKNIGTLNIVVTQVADNDLDTFFASIIGSMTQTQVSPSPSPTGQLSSPLLFTSPTASQ